MKVAIMTDDNSGMTREEAAGLGIFYDADAFFYKWRAYISE